jgi:hypothetical protein
MRSTASLRGVMKKFLLALGVLSILTANSEAQTEATTEPRPLEVTAQDTSTGNPGAAPQGSRFSLPENPVPVLPGLQDGPPPCPSGNGKSCALLGGRLYFSDALHMREHDESLVKAMKNPGLLTVGAINLAATVLDIEGTQACVHAHTCRELNPLFGTTPSRGRAYGIAVPLAFANYMAAAALKKSGRGNTAFGVLWCTTIAHFAMAVDGFATARK